MADYDLNEIADALATAVQGLDTYVIDGQQQEVTATGDVQGVANVPAIAFELDVVDWDITMARGADAFTFLAYLLVSSADSPSGQRLVRQLLSTGGLAGRVKDALNPADGDRTLGGLVSYAHVTGTRTIGNINYAGADYQGAVLEIEVVAQ
jgi:hypothetical protein